MCGSNLLLKAENTSVLLHFFHKGFCKALIVGWSIVITEQLEVTDCGIESGPFVAY